MNTSQTTSTLEAIFEQLKGLSQSQLEELITQAKAVKLEGKKKREKAIVALQSIQKDFEGLDIQLFEEAGYSVDEIINMTPERLTEVMYEIISN